ncbi:MAG: histidine phosphatase family protein [Rhodospirillaceae bacterium]|nr:histidine phosphatase family protein [Rhodospirillaceae bacterium]MBT6138839.1 histidine phosphatase family protein [Rhodospirillaceae bacterium]
MTVVRFITHAEVNIDPGRPVAEWDLSPEGAQRMCALQDRSWIKSLVSIHSSNEPKAYQSAEILANAVGLGIKTNAGLREHDRSSTGYLPREKFEEMLHAFFRYPEVTVRGWKPAVVEQTRVVTCVETILESDPDGDIAIVSHGGVGALLMAHLAGEEISFDFDQGGSTGGNYFTFDRTTREILQGWRSVEAD